MKVSDSSAELGKKEDFNRLADRERVEATERAGTLRRAIQLSRNYGASLKFDAVEKLRSVLGPRIPFDPNLVEAETEADRVRATLASTVAAPIVQSTGSG